MPPSTDSNPSDTSSTAPPAPEESQGSGKRPNIIRRLYDWTLAWAHTKSGPKALGVLSFAESSFFPIPPDVLLIPLCLGNRSRWFAFALLCSIASVAGGVLGYLIGAGFWEVAQGFFFDYVPGFSPEKFDKFQGMYEENGWLIVFAAGFTPIPFKIFTIGSGVFGLNILTFIFASAVSRSARFFLVAGLIRVFGAPIERFIDRYFNLLAIAFTVLLIGGIFAIKYLF